MLTLPGTKSNVFSQGLRLKYFQKFEQEADFKLIGYLYEPPNIGLMPFLSRRVTTELKKQLQTDL